MSFDVLESTLFMVLIPRASPTILGESPMMRFEAIVGVPCMTNSLPLFFNSQSAAEVVAKNVGGVVFAVSGILYDPTR